MRWSSNGGGGRRGGRRASRPPIPASGGGGVGRTRTAPPEGSTRSPSRRSRFLTVTPSCRREDDTRTPSARPRRSSPRHDEGGQMLLLPLRLPHRRRLRQVRRERRQRPVQTTSASGNHRVLFLFIAVPSVYDHRSVVLRAPFMRISQLQMRRAKKKLRRSMEQYEIDNAAAARAKLTGQHSAAALMSSDADHSPKVDRSQVLSPLESIFR